MPDDKNKFDFGTGSIDKDQWQRDIDNELDEFITRYTNATNKKSGLLLRLAFQDLRRRIANGDMLNRTADGLYQFGSALIRDDKDMTEAYQRALGFMGGLARRQIQTPPAEPEKKTYSPKILNDRFIRYFNPNGSQAAFASLWNSYDDTQRIEGLKSFLGEELKNLDKYLDVSDYDSKDILISRINEFLKTPNITNLNKLGFDKNYLGLLVSEELEDAPKTEEEQVALELDNYKLLLALALNKLLLEALNNSIEGTLQFNWNPGQDFLSGLNNYFLKTLGWTTKNPYIKSGVYFEQDERDKDGKVTFSNRPYYTQKTLGEKDQLYDYILNQYANNYKAKYLGDLNSYFKDFGTRYTSLYENDRNNLISNLNKLFALYNGQGVTNWEKYFTKTDKGYIINGSLDKYGNYAILTQNGIELHNSNKDALAYKLGGILKGADGFVFDTSKYHTESSSEPTSPEQSSSTPKLENSPREMTAADIAAISADILSIGASSVPGYGTAASAVLGVGSTLSNFISDINDSNTSLGDALWNGAKGLGADAIGLVPGFGAGAKGWKIATRLAKYGTSILAGLNTLDLALNSPEIMNSFKKVLSLKVSDMDLLDWRNIQNGLSMLATAGRVGHGYAVHEGYKNLLKPTTLKPQEVKALPKTKVEKAKAKLGEFRDKFKGTGETYDYGGPNTLPWYHDANIYLWGANRTGVNPGFKNVYKVDMSTKLLLSPKKESTTNSKSKEEGSKNTLPSDRGLIWNEQTHSYVRTKEIGGVLKALRNGGIIKAKWGDDTSDWTSPLYTPEILKQEDKAIYTNPYFPNVKYGGTAPWYKSRFSGESVVNLGNDASGRADLPGGLTGNNLNYAFARNLAYVKSGLLNKLADILGYFDLLPSPIDANNLQGLTDIYNQAIDELYLPFTSGEDTPDYLKTDATKHNLLFRQVYGSRAKVNGGDDNYDIGWNPDIIKTFGSASFARRPVNYETKWEDDLKNNLALAKDRVSKISHNGIEGYVYTDENGRIHPLTNDLLKLINGQQAPQKLDKEKESSKVTDSETGKGSIFETKFKNPTDPTPWLIAGKTALGLMGNRNIYKNLLDEMPKPALHDPIDRQLAIVGWQEQIKQGQNQLADLRNATWMQHGADQQTNLAGMHEVENKGRRIMDEKYMKDSERQFDTAQKLWNLENDDTFLKWKNRGENADKIEEYKRTIARIRAAWRSGDNNILMGALSDTGNWRMKKYQRELDLINLAREQLLGTKELFMENYLKLKNPNYEALKAEYETTKDINRKKLIATLVLEMQIKALREAPSDWALKLYTTFHTPGFGGGYKESLVAKDGTKLEVAKLKARSKDNDRYVSMIKDLRKSSYRRRRR